MRTTLKRPNFARPRWNEETCVLLAWVAFVPVLEIAGRRIETDVGDALALLAVGLAMLWTGLVHARRPLRWVSGVVTLAKRVRVVVEAFEIELGVDLRREPELPRAFPGRLLISLMVVLLAVVGLASTRAYFPDGVRQLLVQGSYVVYLVLLGGLWICLLWGGMAMAYFSMAQVHDLFVSAHQEPGPRPRNREVMTLVGGVTLLVLAGFLLPVWVAPLLCGVIGAITLTPFLLPDLPDVTLLWRSDADSPLRRVHLREYMAAQYILPLGVVLALILLSRGSSLIGAGDGGEHAIITPWLGLFFAWASVAGIAALSFHFLRYLILGLSIDPARPCRPSVYLMGDADDADRRRWTERLRADGFDVREGSRSPRPNDEPVLMEREPSSTFDLLGPTGPVRLAPAVPLDDATLGRIRRRFDVRQRRRLVRGLERVFKLAARSNYAKGEGFWVAPHLWYVLGLSRDQTDDESESIVDEIVGPPYHRIMARSVRNYAYRVFQAAQVDLIFVEDGVHFRRFRRVLDVLFEVHDLFGGQRRAEERHFVGLPGVRVVLHEFILEKPFRSEVYPEPDYEDIGRARILHVFKDRRDDEDPVEDPVDLEDVPVPVLVHS